MNLTKMTSLVAYFAWGCFDVRGPVSPIYDARQALDRIRDHSASRADLGSPGRQGPRATIEAQGQREARQAGREARQIILSGA